MTTAGVLIRSACSIDKQTRFGGFVFIYNAGMDAKRNIRSELGYWRCGIDSDEHRHATKEDAQSCKDSRAQMAQKPSKPRIKWTPDMYMEALQRFESGESLRSLGDTVGVTAERMRQVIAKARRLRLNR